MRSLGILIAVLGALAMVTGLLIATGGLSWFGRLPGDIQIKGEGYRVYIPITSMILVSLVVTLILNVIARFFR